MTQQNPPFACPVCALPLLPVPGGCVCEHGHRFDRAAKGYLNLLPAGRKPSAHIAGDDRVLLQARREFLNTGLYAPLADALSDLLSTPASKTEKNAATITPEAFAAPAANSQASEPTLTLIEGEEFAAPAANSQASAPALAANSQASRMTAQAVILDAGCGEGYYTAAVAKRLPDTAVVGLDIAKDAVMMACARSKTVHWAVANVFRLPLPDNGADAALCVFAPFCAPELHRVLRQGGFALAVLPGARHLYELKKLLYDQPYENDETPPDGGALTAGPIHRLRYTMHVKKEALEALFSMTPYACRTGPDGLARLRACGDMEVTADFLIVRYEKS